MPLSSNQKKGIAVCSSIIVIIIIIIILVILFANGSDSSITNKPDTPSGQSDTGDTSGPVAPSGQSDTGDTSGPSGPVATNVSISTYVEIPAGLILDNRASKLTLSDNGKLCINKINGEKIWCASAGLGAGKYKMIFQQDGNIGVYTVEGAIKWALLPHGLPGTGVPNMPFKLTLDTDNILRLTNKDGKEIWNSGNDKECTNMAKEQPSLVPFKYTKAGFEGADICQNKETRDWGAPDGCKRDEKNVPRYPDGKLCTTILYSENDSRCKNVAKEMPQFVPFKLIKAGFEGADICQNKETGNWGAPDGCTRDEKNVPRFPDKKLCIL